LFLFCDMGLDQYGLRKKGTENAEQIAYWRKHNALHGWMENLWIAKGRPFVGTKQKGNEKSNFNSIPIELTEDDLIQLGIDTKNYHLPKTKGFFFGTDSSEDPNRLKEVLDFVEAGLESIREGYEIAYYAWW